MSTHTFEYDDSVLDAAVKSHLEHFYTLSDDKENCRGWAECFTEDAIMKKATTDVKGRDEIEKVNKGSWTGMASRQHIVQKVFPFGPKDPNELMLNGMSKYKYEDGSTGEMRWAALLKFSRTENGVLINFYHIFPSPAAKSS